MSAIEKFLPLWGIWQIDGEIGFGSFSKVYKASREEFGNKYYCAIKHISIPKDEEEIQQYFRENVVEDESVASKYYSQVVTDITNEIYTMYNLNGSANIVIYQEHLIIPKESGVGFDVFIKMELLTDLLARAKKIKFSQQEVVKLGLDICSALEVCAAKNLIHRDIKPQNIFVSDDGVYKLGDFGISRQLEKTTGGLSKKGTNNYMAPEVFRGDEYSGNVDIYSLGLVMYFLANGNRLPFMPQGEVRYDDSEKARNRRLKGDPFPKPLYAGDKLAKIILKMCAFDRKDRYSSATKVKEALLALNKSDLSAKAFPVATPLVNNKPKENTEVIVAPVINQTFEPTPRGLANADTTAFIASEEVTSVLVDDLSVKETKPDKPVAQNELAAEKKKKDSKLILIFPWLSSKLAMAISGMCIVAVVGSLMINGANRGTRLSAAVSLNADEKAKITGSGPHSAATEEPSSLVTMFKVEFDPNGGELLPDSTSADPELNAPEGEKNQVNTSNDKNSGNEKKNNDSRKDNSKKVEEGKEIGKLPETKKSDAIFLGWFTAKEIGEGEEVDESYVVTSDIILYAHWQEADDKEKAPITVHLDANNGSVTKTSIVYKYGDRIGQLPEATRKDYDFLGWFTAKSGGNQINSTFVLTKDLTVYAQWRDKTAPIVTYTVTFDASGGSCNTTSKSVNNGDAVGSLPSAARDNYDFLGWFTAKTGGTNVNANYVITQNTTLYAQWKDKAAPIVTYTVTFDANGGSASTSSKSVNNGNAVGTLPSATRDYYDLSGWFTAKTGGTKVDANYVITANTVLYAQWKDKPISGWVAPSSVPSGAKIVDRKWTYTQTKSSGTVESGYTLISTAYGDWGAWSAWQDGVITETKDPHNSAQLLKKVETQILPATTITKYFYFRYRPPNNAWSSYVKDYNSPQGKCTVYTTKYTDNELILVGKYGTNNRYWAYKVNRTDGDAGAWWYDSNKSKTVQVEDQPAKTQYRSASRSVTYTYKKDNIETTTQPSPGPSISNIVEYVKYVNK